jgi:hypothetical protein
VPVVLDGDVRAQIEAVEDELDRLVPDPETDRRLATRTKPPAARVAELEAEATRLREAAAGTTLYVVLEGMAGTPYRALLAAHPPRKDTEGKTLPSDLTGVNEETVRAPLVRSCVIGHRVSPDADSPVLPLEDEYVQWLTDWATDRQMDNLVAASWAVCRGDDAVPLSRRRSQTRTSAAG